MKQATANGFIVALVSLVSVLRPGIAAEAAVVVEPYQNVVYLNCVNSTCLSDLPVVAANTRILIRRMSCHISTPPTIQVTYGVIWAINVSNDSEGSQFLVAEYKDAGITLFNEQLELTLAAGRHARIRFWLKSPFAYHATCSLFGLRYKF